MPKDVFDFPLAEIAAMLGTSVGAVKAALHRGRDRLGAPDPARQEALGRRPAPDRAVLDAMAAAFTAYDIEALTALLLTDAASEVVGMVYEVGTDTIRRGSLHHTLVVEDTVRYRAQVHELDGEPLLLWETPTDDSAPEAVSDLLRVDTADGRAARLRWYYFCPETITEVTQRLGVTARPTGTGSNHKGAAHRSRRNNEPSRPRRAHPSPPSTPDSAPTTTPQDP